MTSDLTAASSGATNPPTSEKSQQELPPEVVVEIWKKVVDVQQHFNDIGMTIRNLFFTIIAAAIGLLGAFHDKKWLISSMDLQISLSMILISGLIPVSMLFYFLDRHWYHRLLRGAVNQGILIENAYAGKLPIQLGAQIEKTSPVEVKGAVRRWILKRFVSDERFQEKNMLHSDAKIEVLYKSVIATCVVILVLYSLFGGVRVGQTPIVLWLIEGGVRFWRGY